MKTPSSARPARQLERWFLVLELAGTALLVLQLVTFAVRVQLQQGDLRTYQIAARAEMDGTDPYVPGTLAALAGRATTPFVYPPVALVPLLPLAALPYPVAAAGWMTSNALLLVGLVVLWRALFPGARILPLALSAVLGWNASALWALRSGNVAVLEAACVWAALACFVHGRRRMFAALVVAAACWKLLPAAFLLLLLVPTAERRPAPRVLVAAACALTLLVFGPMAVEPFSNWTPFWRHLPEVVGLNASNPSLLALAYATLGSLGLGDASALLGATLAWAVYATLLLWASVPLLRATWLARDPRRWVLVSVFLYVLLEPRPMAYGYLMLVPAPLLLAPGTFSSARRQLVLAVVLAAEGFATVTQHGIGAIVVTHSPFLFSLCFWLLLIQAAATARVSVQAEAESPAFAPAGRAA